MCIASRGSVAAGELRSFKDDSTRDPDLSPAGCRLQTDPIICGINWFRTSVEEGFGEDLPNTADAKCVQHIFSSQEASPRFARAPTDRFVGSGP